MFRSEASFPNYFAHLFAHKIFAHPFASTCPFNFFRKKYGMLRNVEDCHANCTHSFEEKFDIVNA